jgi:methylenetetrahydrofolate reductase (NADPH)
VSLLEQKLDSGVFVITAEMPVIDGGGHAELQRQLEFMRPYVDAYNATDNPAAHAHVSPLAVSIGLLQLGAEPVMQLVCRDKNRLALQADLMGAAMYGVENVCCLTGDDVTAGDEPEARRVFDLDGVQLIALARMLERGHYLSGRPIGTDATGMRFCVGAVENPSAPPLDYRIRRAAKKALAGARFLQLQMTYRTELLERFLGAAVDSGLSARLAMIPSIMILRSAGAMRFVASSVPGIDMPAELVRRVESAADAEAECFEIAYELASHAISQPGVAGLHFISFRKDAGIAKLCARLGIETKQERERHGHSPSVALG